MKKISHFGIAVGGVIVLLLVWWACIRLGIFQGEPVPSGNIQEQGEEHAEGEKREAQAFELVPVATELQVPWSAVFTSEERLLVTERAGRVRVIEQGVKREEPLYTFSEVSATSEEGLMGMALDPQYQENKYIYFSYAYEGNGGQKVRVVRLRDEGERLADEQILIENIPAAQYHAGCRLAFGPDQKLYITTGDATDKSTPQNLESLGGKILRLNPDGSVPEDNPFEGSPVYSYGHRNSQGITWDTRNGEMYATEHGPSIFDGPAGGDEVNHIMPAANYGWPLVSHKEKAKDTEEPLLVFTPAVAPAGILFYTGTQLPQFTNTLLFAGLKGEGLYQVSIDEDDPESVDEYQKIEGVAVGRIRDVFQGPDGSLYIMTSNRDGRGKPATNDDVIYRLQPKS